MEEEWKNLTIENTTNEATSPEETEEIQETTTNEEEVMPADFYDNYYTQVLTKLDTISKNEETIIENQNTIKQNQETLINHNATMVNTLFPTVIFLLVIAFISSWLRNMLKVK